MDTSRSPYAWTRAGARVHLRREERVIDHGGPHGGIWNDRHRSAGRAHGDVLRFASKNAGTERDRVVSGTWSGDGECEGEDSRVSGSPPRAGKEHTCRLDA